MCHNLWHMWHIVLSVAQSVAHSKTLWTNLVHMVHKVLNVDQFWSTKFSFYRRFNISGYTVSTLRFRPTIVLKVCGIEFKDLVEQFGPHSPQGLKCEPILVHKVFILPKIYYFTFHCFYVTLQSFYCANRRV